MHQASFLSFPEKDTKFALFLFFSLLISSMAVFVFAGEPTSTQNIFQDSDQDGLSNDEEKLYGTDPSDKDSDDDGYGDGVEVGSGYDPLKPAPGDKIVKEKNDIPSVSAQASAKENLTQKVSSEIVNILQNSEDSNGGVSLDDVNSSVQKMLSGNIEEVTLPDVDTKDIRIKKLPKNLKEKDRDERKRKDVVEYLTVMSYLVANNSPRTFQTEDDLSRILRDISGDSIASLSSGDTDAINQLSKRGEKMLEELKDVEVPENMFDIHIKALKMANYAMQLKGELRSPQSDPLGQIAALSRIQGFLGSITGLTDEMRQVLIDYGIDEIPLNL